jgi:RNA methyltransferase, TrmH family
MISKAKIKWIKSLQLKKYRQEEQCFVVQGRKSVIELLRSDFKIQFVAGTPDAIGQAKREFAGRAAEWFVASAGELENLGTFQSNEEMLAVAKMREAQTITPSDGKFMLVLDGIQDPGNLGTMIRTADWFGVDTIIASPNTADFYNPKTISSTMGSFCRVDVFYTDIVSLLFGCELPVYGAFLTGTNIHNQKFGSEGLIVIGNESNGISPAVEQLVSNKIFIPGSGRTQSLNAAIATGIILDNIFRQK